MVRFCWLFVNVLGMGLLCFTLFVVLFVALVTCALRLGASFLLGLLVVFFCVGLRIVAGEGLLSV